MRGNRNLSMCGAKDDNRQCKPRKEAPYLSCSFSSINHLAPNDHSPLCLSFHICLLLFCKDISKWLTLKLALRTSNVQTLVQSLSLLGVLSGPQFLTWTMFPQFPLVLLIWKEIKSSPSMPVHCLSLILTPSLSKPSWKSLHLDMDTSIWDALQVTSASIMSCESVGKLLQKASQWKFVSMQKSRKGIH